MAFKNHGERYLGCLIYILHDGVDEGIRDLEKAWKKVKETDSNPFHKYKWIAKFLGRILLNEPEPVAPTISDVKNKRLADITDDDGTKIARYEQAKQSASSASEADRKCGARVD